MISAVATQLMLFAIAFNRSTRVPSGGIRATKSEPGREIPALESFYEIES
jgi:hypothetical protein